MHLRKFLLPAIITLLSAIPSAAQFYVTGANPASTKWSYIESPNYRVIYPRELDSLASAYALSLEKYRIPVSRSVNYVPGEYSWNKIPVVLHPYNAYSNGSVAWAPRRMDLYTSPQAYTPEAMPWMTMLSIHESRHVAQMQFGLSHVFRPFRYAFGEMFNGLMAGLYPDKWLLEGDAVVAETALSDSGRGRTANFLNYYRIAFDYGDFRNYDRWAYGSYKYYTPDYYALGYLFLGGIRYTFDVPQFSGELFRHFAKRPYDLCAKHTVTRKLTGQKNFYAAMDTARLVWMDIWAKNAEKRAPFLPYTIIGKTRGEYTEYSESVVIGEDLYVLKESFDKSRRLMKVDSLGREKSVCSFAGEIGMLYWSEVLERLVWSETVPDKRWPMKYRSVIRTMDLQTGRKRNLTHEGRLFNPSPCPSEKHIAVTEYTDDGRSHLVVLDGFTGEREASFDLPDSLQLVCAAWLDHRIFATCISQGGYGIYHLHVDERVWEQTLAPSPVMISNLSTHEDGLMFVSDRTGSDELYFFNPDTGSMVRKTSSRYGAVDYAFSEDGRYVYCSLHERKGAYLVRIPAESLLNEEVDFFDRYVDPVAEKLTQQEKELADANPDSVPDGVEISAPRKYRRVAHAFNIHSWAPVYFNYDNIASQSFDHYYDIASLGTTALFQNRLGTFYGQIGYSAHKDLDDRGFWRHSGHLNLTYTGMYPVIEAKIDFNDQAATHSYMTKYYTLSGLSVLGGLQTELTSIPDFNAEISAYIPFNFSSGGWLRGLIPQLSYSVSNNIFDTGVMNVLVQYDPDTMTQTSQVTSQEAGTQFWMQALSGALRFYTMMSAAHSEIYPDLGIGVEAGAFCYPGLTDYLSPSAYLYAYGYLPGLTGTQGLRLSAMYRQQVGSSRFAAESVNILPRGLSSQTFLRSYTAASPAAVKITADYAIPFYMGDINILKTFYVMRGVLTPHFDYALYRQGSLWSVGVSFAIDFGNFLTISYPMQFGVTYSYNGGSLLTTLSSSSSLRHYIGPIVNISF